MNWKCRECLDDGYIWNKQAQEVPCVCRYQPATASVPLVADGTGQVSSCDTASQTSETNGVDGVDSTLEARYGLPTKKGEVLRLCNWGVTRWEHRLDLRGTKVNTWVKLYDGQYVVLAFSSAYVGKPVYGGIDPNNGLPVLTGGDKGQQVGTAVGKFDPEYSQFDPPEVRAWLANLKV